MAWLVRGIVLFLILLAAFWLVAVFVGWVGYVLMAIGAVAFVGFLIWLFVQREPAETNAKPTKRAERRATKELSKLEQRLKNPSQH